MKNMNEVEITIYPDGRMNARNAAKYLGVSEKTIASYRVMKTGPKYLKRGRIFYFKDDLDDWLQKGMIYL